MTAARRTVADAMADKPIDLQSVVKVFRNDVLPTIRINDVEYGTPFVFVWDPLPQLDRNRLKARISKVGMTYPPVTYESPRWGLCLIDGINRVLIAGELHIPVPEPIHHGKKSDEWAFEEAKSLNRDRRQSTREQLAAVEKKQIGEILELRRQQYSQRAIAAQVGVSHKKVRTALNTVPTGTGSDPDDSDGKVIGTDGNRHRKGPVIKPEPDPLRDTADAIRDVFQKLADGFDIIATKKVEFAGSLEFLESVLAKASDFGADVRAEMLPLLLPLLKPGKKKGGPDAKSILSFFTVKNAG